MNDDKLIPESLREVWRWKEAVAKEYEGLSDEETVRRMNEKAERFMKEHGLVLPRRPAARGRRPVSE
jgi:hypothetical protein